MSLKIEYKFNDLSLLKTALTHSSFNRESESNEEDNERLEFLGDAFLDAIVGAKLYKKMTQYPEGKLTKTTDNVIKKYIYDENIDTTNKTAVIDMYYKKNINGKEYDNTVIAVELQEYFAKLYPNIKKVQVEAGELENEYNILFTTWTFDHGVKLIAQGEATITYRTID